MLTAKELRKEAPKHKYAYEKILFEDNLSRIDNAFKFAMQTGKTSVQVQLNQLNTNVTKMVVDRLNELGYTVEVSNEICLTIGWGE